MLRWLKQRSAHVSDLAKLLAEPENKKSLLGVKDARLPNPNAIRSDAAKLSRYSEAEDYKVFAEEAWGRILSHLDIILDDKTPHERVQYHRGALKETLDLLRVSYQARAILKDSEPLPR